MQTAIPKDWCEEMKYRYEERIGIMCGKQKPTLEQHQLACMEAVQWKLSQPLDVKCIKCGIQSQVERDEFGFSEKLVAGFMCDPCASHAEGLRKREYAKRFDPVLYKRARP